MKTETQRGRMVGKQPKQQVAKISMLTVDNILLDHMQHSLLKIMLSNKRVLHKISYLSHKEIKNIKLFIKIGAVEETPAEYWLTDKGLYLLHRHNSMP